MWYVCSKLLPLWPDRMFLCLIASKSLQDQIHSVSDHILPWEPWSFLHNAHESAVKRKQTNFRIPWGLCSFVSVFLKHESGLGLYAQVRWCQWTFRSCWTFGPVYKGNIGRWTLTERLHHAPCGYICWASWSCTTQPVRGLSQGSPKETVGSHLDALCFSPHQHLDEIPYPSLPHHSEKSVVPPPPSVSSQQAEQRPHFLWLAATTAPAERSQDGCRQQMDSTYEPAPPISQSPSEPKAKITHYKTGMLVEW